MQAGVSRREGNAYNVDPMLLDFGSDEEDEMPDLTAGSNSSHQEGASESSGRAAGPSGLREGKSSQDLVKQEAKLRGRYPSQTNLEKGKALKRNFLNPSGPLDPLIIRMSHSQCNRIC